MKLYHGAIYPVVKPDIHKCKLKTDFGQGFYTTTSIAQAEKWAKLKQKRANSPDAVVSVYDIDDEILTHYNVRYFKVADKEWLDFVLNNRRAVNDLQYDIVQGPVANDTLYTTLMLYEQGILGIEATIMQLKTYTLYDQISFHSTDAIATLNFIESQKI
jgi:hypothetical protein